MVSVYIQNIADLAEEIVLRKLYSWFIAIFLLNGEYIWSCPGMLCCEGKKYLSWSVPYI